MVKSTLHKIGVKRDCMISELDLTKQKAQQHEAVLHRIPATRKLKRSQEAYVVFPSPKHSYHQMPNAGQQRLKQGKNYPRLGKPTWCMSERTTERGNTSNRAAARPPMVQHDTTGYETFSLLSVPRPTF